MIDSSELGFIRTVPSTDERDRVRAVLVKLTDADLITSARKVAGAGGPLSVLLTELLDRYERHVRRSAEEIERLAAILAALHGRRRRVSGPTRAIDRDK